MNRHGVSFSRRAQEAQEFMGRYKKLKLSFNLPLVPRTLSEDLLSGQKPRNVHVRSRSAVLNVDFFSKIYPAATTKQMIGGQGFFAVFLYRNVSILSNFM